MIAPTLLVGLGGTGLSILAKTSELTTEEQRRMIEFVAMDTDLNDLRNLQEKHPHIKTIPLASRVTVDQYLSIDTKARDEWFPLNDVLKSKPLGNGTGQVRAISRLAFDISIKYGMEPIHEAIVNLNEYAEESGQPLRAIIVSSLAGGTGSGSILPAAMYIRNHILTKFSYCPCVMYGFFTLPSIHYSLITSNNERNNLKCNAYAAIRELNAFNMKGNHTLPEEYRDKFKIEFPSVTSEGYEEYDLRPYDFCFLFDAHNIEGQGLLNYEQYLEHASNCIYSQVICQTASNEEYCFMRSIIKERALNHYAGIGSSFLIYPVKDVTDYITYKCIRETISDKWLTFDMEYKEKCKAEFELFKRGFQAQLPDIAQHYVNMVHSYKTINNPFAGEIINSCTRYDKSDLIPEKTNIWDDYIVNLRNYVEKAAFSKQPEIQRIRHMAVSIVRGLKGGKIIDDYIDAYNILKKYKILIEDNCPKVAKDISDNLFHSNSPEFQFETYLRDSEGYFMHPNAIRYFLYQTKADLQREKESLDMDVEYYKDYFDTFERRTFDNPKTEEIEDVYQLGSWVKTSRFYNMPSKDQIFLKQMYLRYLENADWYLRDLVRSEVYKEGIDYVTKLADAFRDFYLSLEGKLNELDTKTGMLSMKYENKTSEVTRYVCSSSKCMDIMSEKICNADGFENLYRELSESIYNSVRQYALMENKPVNEVLFDPEDVSYKNSYFDGFFDKDIVDGFRRSILKVHGNEINMDILTALKTELEFEKNIADEDKLDAEIRKIITETKKKALPFIEMPLGREIKYFATSIYNPELNSKDGTERLMLGEDEISGNGGSACDDIPINMIMFKKTIYGISASEIPAFEPASGYCIDGGEYFKAYHDIVKKLNSDADEIPIITPHLDRNWHKDSIMPEIDENIHN